MPKSLGIFCFETLQNARDFQLNHRDMIIKVEPIGKGVRRRVRGSLNCIREFYADRSDPYLKTDTPIGTICFPAVKVLE